MKLIYFNTFFSRDMFNKWQAQKWWTDNYEKVMELYNVQKLNQQAFPLPTPLKSEDEVRSISQLLVEFLMTFENGMMTVSVFKLT